MGTSSFWVVPVFETILYPVTDAFFVELVSILHISSAVSELITCLDVSVSVTFIKLPLSSTYPFQQMRGDEISAVCYRGKRTDMLEHGYFLVLAERSRGKVNGSERLIIYCLPFSEHVAAGGPSIAERIKILKKTSRHRAIALSV